EVKEDARPIVHGRTVGRHMQQVGERRPDNEREHQEYVGIEQEAQRCGRADCPLERSQSWGGRNGTRDRHHPNSQATEYILTLIAISTMISSVIRVHL